MLLKVRPKLRILIRIRILANMRQAEDRQRGTKDAK